MPKELDVRRLERIIDELEEGYREEQEERGVYTSLAHKHYEPLIVRRFVTRWGVPMFVALICGDDLSDLDGVLLWYQEKFEMSEDIQGVRDWVGRLGEILAKYYSKVEGVAVVLYADKMAVSSLYGDFMNHMGCRNELYMILNWMNGV